MDVSARVAIAAFVVCAPTLLFLGLWRGMTSLREDDLAGEVSARQLRGVFEVLPSGQPDAGRFENVPDGDVEAAALGRSHRSDEASTTASRSGRASKSGPRADEDGTRGRTLASASDPGSDVESDAATAIEIGVETDPRECSRCMEPNPTGAELCWGCGAYLSGPDGTA